MHRTRRRLAALLYASVLLCATAFAQDAPRCTCEYRRACYHYLNAPVSAPDDECSCALCASGDVHVPGQSVPDGWNRACFASNRMACFLKRHAASWRITCSACVANDTCCPFPHHATCPKCGDVHHVDPFDKDALHQDARASIDAQLAIEKRFFDPRRAVVAYSRRFYVVTDIPKMRLLDQKGGVRWATTHEYAHLMLQRAELAYDELVEELGGGVKLLRPMGIYLPKSEREARKLQGAYFRAERSHMIYSSYPSRSESAISEGFCLNGFCVSLERVKKSAAAVDSLAGDDAALHGSLRHLLTHVLTTCWVVRNGENRTMPRWAFIGAAHWFGKRLRKHRDVVTYCTGETGRMSGPGDDWRERLRKRAVKGDLAPVEELLRKSSLGQFSYDDHMQCWGLFDVAMSSEVLHDPWIALLRDLRDERDVREAFEDRLGMTPEAYQTLVITDLVGKGDLTTAIDHDAPPEMPLASEDAETIAASFRALGRIEEPAQVEGVLQVAGIVRSDLVRETALLVLLRAETPRAREAIVAGLSAERPLARAYAARACRLLDLASAKNALRGLTNDAHWLVRAESLLASAALRDHDAQRGMRELTGDGSPKVRIAAMDALAMLGEDANSLCLPLVARNLEHDRWQVRVAAAQCLSVIGDVESVQPLLDRLDAEGGRVKEELLAALRALSGEDFGDDSGRWRTWWKMERPHAEERGGLAITGERKKDEETPSRYARDQPTYYGREVFSRRIAFVLDTSRSTHRNFRPDRGTRKRLLGDYAADTVTIAEITRSELALALDSLDPRARFNVIVFGSDVTAWKPALVRATAGNKRGAASFARSRAPAGETNFHGALTAALELGDRTWEDGDLRDTADTVDLLTDGSPTVGDISDPELLARWFVEVNRYARTRLDVFVFGTLGVNETFLQRLAADGGGTFTQLTESNPR